MRNPIIKSIFVVFFFWYVVLYLLSTASLVELPEHLFLVLMRVGAGVAAGMILVLTYEFVRKGNMADAVQGKLLRGAKCKIGPLPEPGRSAPEKRGHVPDTFWHQFEWWPAYSSRFPRHANVFRAAAAVMFAEQKMPASAIPGGHGGATLIAHSVRVTHKMLDMCTDWKYFGQTNKQGVVIFPLLDKEAPHHAFVCAYNKSELLKAQFEPILPLCAFVHDIGKLRCYRQKNTTEAKKGLFFNITNRKQTDAWRGEPFEVLEIKEKHGLEGARLLRNLPEVHQLPMDERDALLIAVGYYHHIEGLPTVRWITDRARSLVHLLYQSDIAAGYDEERQGTAPKNIGGKQCEPERTENVVLNTNENIEPTVDVASSASDHVAPSVSLPWAIEAVSRVISGKGRINGQGKGECGQKVGEWVYLYDKRLRGIMAESMNRPELNGQPDLASLHPFTRELLVQLNSQGWLFREFKGEVYDVDKALWDIQYVSKVGRPTRMHSVIIASIDAFEFLKTMQDADHIAVEMCSFGGESARFAGANAAIVQAGIVQNTVSTASGVNIDQDLSVDTEDAVDKALRENVKEFKPKLTVKILANAEKNMGVVFRVSKGVAYFAEDELKEKYEFDREKLDAGLFTLFGKKTNQWYIYRKPE